MLNIGSNYIQPSVRFKDLASEVRPQATSTNSDENHKLGTKSKLILGTTLTGLAALGIYLATRGKAKSVTIDSPFKNSKSIEFFNDMININKINDQHIINVLKATSDCRTLNFDSGSISTYHRLNANSIYSILIKDFSKCKTKEEFLSLYTKDKFVIPKEAFYEFENCDNFSSELIKSLESINEQRAARKLPSIDIPKDIPNTEKMKILIESAFETGREDIKNAFSGLDDIIKNNTEGTILTDAINKYIQIAKNRAQFLE